MCDKFDQSLAKHLIKNMDANLANILIDVNALEDLITFFNKSQNQLFISLMIYIITYHSNKKLNISTLWKLSQLNANLYEKIENIGIFCHKNSLFIACTRSPSRKWRSSPHRYRVQRWTPNSKILSLYSSIL